MKIILDVDALSPPLTGIGYYTNQLMKGLEKDTFITDLKLVRAGKILEPSEFSIPTGTANSLTAAARKLPFRALLRWGYHNYREARFWHSSVQKKDYILHAPNYSLLPFTGRSLVTIHDLSFIRHPEFHPAERVRYWRRAIQTVVKRADRIITDSHYQKNEIIDLLDVDESLVAVTHLGVSENFRPYELEECEPLLLDSGLTYKQFSLVVATVEPRKNFERIISAFLNLPKAFKESYPLVIVGDKGWLSDNVHKSIETLIAQGYAYRLGYVTDDQLWRLYASAAVFVYPSLYEGFGLPVLEAMASGTAVLSSNTTSIPEVVGDSGVLVDPKSSDALTDAWLRLLDDVDLRSKLSITGLERARTFSWERCVNDTIRVYKQLGEY